jgi:hypothetical protein
VAIVSAYCCRTPQDNRVALYQGTPGDAFAPDTALPATDDFVPSKVTIDMQNASIVVVGQGSDGTNEGVYVASMFWDSQWQWTGPTLIDSLKKSSTDYVVESVAANNYGIWVGLLKPHVTGVAQKYSLFVDHGLRTGQRIGAVHLLHSTIHDTALQLSFNQNTGHLHAAFTRVDASSKVNGSGIVTEGLINGKWHDVRFITHWIRDRTAEITFTTAGTTIIGYTQS